jgi:hypothetical protein
MTKCECCDHQLQHAIRVAINEAPYVGYKMALTNLEDTLEMWEDANAAT